MTLALDPYTTEPQDTPQAIYLALIRLMHQRPLASITISQITREAGVSRPTFYRYFDGKMAVIHWYCQKVFDQFMKTLSMYAEEDISNQHIAYTSFYYWEEQSVFIEVLIDHEIDHVLMDRLKEFTQRSPLKFQYENDRERAYKVSFFAGGVFNLVRDWIRSGKRESIDEMSAILSGIVS